MSSVIRIGCLAFFLILTLSIHPTFAATILVPADYATIQGAIDAAVDGDDILVAPDIYVENIDFLGKWIILQSEAGAEATVIDGGQSGSIVTFASHDIDEATIKGFTITNGTGTYDPDIGRNCGGGIYCLSSSPSIMNCVIAGNSINGFGAGIYCSADSSPLVEACTITENTADGWGGGFSCTGRSSPTIINCIISNNDSTPGYGGGISIKDSSTALIKNCSIMNNIALNGGGIGCDTYSSALIKNCLILENIATWRGGGIFCYDHSNPTITNCTLSGNAGDQGGGIHAGRNSTPIVTSCILWGDSGMLGPQEIYLREGGSIVITFSDVQEGWTGEGNIEADPLFTGPDDFHLESGSPCIDAGDPDPLSADDCFPPSMGTEHNDMGAFGGPGACGFMGCPDLDLDLYQDIACGGSDCDDSNPDINPSGEEHCDEIDWDCTGDPFDKDIDEDGFIDGDPACMGDDCDDSDPAIYPGAPEICNGEDDDCDEIVPADETDGDGDGWIACAECDDTDPQISPDMAEGLLKGNCSDEVDNDCDGLTDFLDPVCRPFWVPSAYPTIQEGIDAAEDGGLILVDQGTYSGDIGFNGKAITLKSSYGAFVTTIEGDGSVVTFNSGESMDTILDGFTITGGTGTKEYVPGSITIHRGGGILFMDSSPIIVNCVITQNRFTSDDEYDFGFGGGIYCNNSSPTITNCIISNNGSDQVICVGGGLFCENMSMPLITHCTFRGTPYDAYVIGSYADMSSLPIFTNCILWSPWHSFLVTTVLGQAIISYSDVKGGWPGAGNIEADPRFVDAGNGDYHITAASPCINAGTAVLVSKDIDGEWRQVFSGFDMGADEYWSE